MGYRGLPSKGCSSCRSRRIKCDLSTPSCGQCVRSHRTCFGYRNLADLLFHDQSEEVARKARRPRQTFQPNAVAPKTKLSATTLDSSHFPSRLDTPPTLLSHLPTAESQALCFFFSNYPSQPSTHVRSIYQDIPALYCLATCDSPLVCVLTALGLAGLSYHTETSGMEVAARAWYDKALHKVNRSLRDQDLVKLDETILVVLLLGLYETNTCATPRSMRSWLSHIKGATALLDLRGEEQLDSELGRSLFIQARTQIIAGCYQTRSPVPEVVVQLSHKCGERSADHFEDFNLLVIQSCNIKSAYPFNPPIAQLESTTRAAIASYKSIAEAFADRYGGLPTACLPSTVSPVTTSTEILSEHYDVYEDVWAAGISNNYRANIILVHEALIAQLDFLRVRYSHDLDEVLELEDQSSNSRRTLLSLIDAICASVPNLLRSNLAVAGVALLWPLYVSAQISPQAAPVPDGTRSWMISRLEKIGVDLGVRQATMLAGLLYEEIEVTDLWKDE